jgi:hypothetical protein
MVCRRRGSASAGSFSRRPPAPLARRPNPAASPRGQKSRWPAAPPAAPCGPMRGPRWPLSCGPHCAGLPLRPDARAPLATLLRPPLRACPLRSPRRASSAWLPVASPLCELRLAPCAPRCASLAWLPEVSRRGLRRPSFVASRRGLRRPSFVAPAASQKRRQPCRSAEGGPPY